MRCINYHQVNTLISTILFLSLTLWFISKIVVDTVQRCHFSYYYMISYCLAIYSENVLLFLLYPHFTIPVSIPSYLSVNKRDYISILEDYFQSKGFLNKCRKSLSYFSYFLTCHEWQLWLCITITVESHHMDRPEVPARNPMDSE